MTSQPVRGNSCSTAPNSAKFRGDDREQIMSARQAAEALFAPKPELAEQPVSDPSQSAKARKVIKQQKSQDSRGRSWG
jgi:hypothetical protein